MLLGAFIELVKSQRGRGWIGLNQIRDSLDTLEMTPNDAQDIRAQMHRSIGRSMLSRDFSPNNSSLIQAYNQCIEELAVTLNARSVNCNVAHPDHMVPQSVHSH